MILGQIF